jgi:glycosyltransferase involved in cell wall biosynthesis
MTNNAKNQSQEHFVSVIIPVFNDSKRLELCLSALENQSYPENLYEVIVVDNGSNDNPEKIINCHKNVKLSQESRRGSYAARNKGISVAKGSIIAFTDSDCIPESDWIEMGVKNLSGIPNCGLLGGKIELFFADPSKPTGVELWESLVAFQQHKYIDIRKYAATANAFTFRSVIGKVGDFNAELLSSGDREWGNRVHSSGYKLIYSDNTIVGHPARRTLKELYSKHKRIITGHYKLNLTDSSVKTLLAESVLPVSSMMRLMKYSKFRQIDGPINKGKVLFIFVFMRYLRVWQRLRLKLSFKSRI